MPPPTKKKNARLASQLDDEALLEILQEGGAYSPILAAKSPRLSGKGDGIQTNEVSAIISGKRQKLRQYVYDETSRDHRSALASRIRYHKDSLLADRDTADTTKFIITNSSGDTLRVDPTYNSKDFVVLPLSEQTGTGSLTHPYRFTNKGLSYKEPNALIESASSLFERGRSDLAGVLGQIAPSLQEAVFAPSGGVKNMKQIEKAKTIKSGSVKTAVAQLRDVATGHGLKTGQEVRDFLKDGRKTPPRPSLASAAPPPLDLGPPALADGAASSLSTVPARKLNYSLRSKGKAPIEE